MCAKAAIELDQGVVEGELEGSAGCGDHLRDQGTGLGFRV